MLISEKKLIFLVIFVIAAPNASNRKVIADMIINRIEDTRLYSLLEEPYKQPVKELCQDAGNLARRTPLYFPEYTLHDSVHFLRVTELEGMIIGDRLQYLEQEEIVLLILAAFYHDIGMACNENELEALKNSNEFYLFSEEWRFSHPNLKELENRHGQDYLSEEEKIKIGGRILEMENAMLTDYLRNKHPEASKEYVIRNLSTHPQLGKLAKELAEICLSHGMSVDWIRNHPTLSASRKYICYILRLADILDFDGDRAPDVLFRSISFSSPVSLQEWEKHIGVKNWSISEDSITFTMEYSHPAYEKAAWDFIGWINQEYAQVRLAVAKLEPDLPGHGIIHVDKVNAIITSKGYVYHDLSFSLSRDQVVHLFMTDNLYGSTSLFVRELLQNSLDALRLRKALKALYQETWTEGEVTLLHYLDEQGQSVIECTDNGCGMDLDIIERYFGRVGQSYYRSHDFERLNASLKKAGAGFDPCSRFGIGFMSVFMVADEIVVYTRKDYGNRIGDPYIIEIKGLSSLFVIRKGEERQPVGTTVRVFERNQPPAYDNLSDVIGLVKTVESYAVACEFPIHAQCTVPGIADSVDVEAGILIHKTFLEELGILSIKKYEIPFKRIDSRLNGVMALSFLADAQGHITLKNTDAEWIRQEDESAKNIGLSQWETYFRFNNEVLPFYPIVIGHTPYTISCDGIVIAGALGPKDQDKLRHEIGEKHILYERGHVFSLDIRGELKPELTPARTPVTLELDEPIGWARVNRLLAQASSLLWDNILRECAITDIPVLWAYLCIYEIRVPDSLTSDMISKKVLVERMALPTKSGAWLPLKEINSFMIQEDEVILTDKNGNEQELFFDQSVLKWIDSTSSDKLLDFAQLILFRTAKLSISDTGQSRLVIDHVPTDNRIMYRMKSEVLEFSGVDSLYIMSLSPQILYNENAPLVKVAARVWGVKDKNQFEQFADALCECLYDYFKYELKDYNDTFKQTGKHFRYCGALYKALDKKKINADYLPPYYILAPQGQRFTITEALLLEWADS